MKWLISFLLLVPGSLFAQELSLDEILNRHARAMGGVDNWRTLKSYLITTESQHQDQLFTTVLTMKAPNKFRIDRSSPTQEQIKSYDGTDGWILLNQELKPMPPGEDLEMAEEAEFYGELVLARERGHQLELLGTEILNGQKVYKVKMTKSPDDEQFYYINAQTFLEDMVSEYSADVSWEGVQFRTVFKDYKEVEGLQFAFGMDLYADERLLRSFTLTEVILNPDIPDHVFNKDHALLRRNMKLFSRALMEEDYETVINSYTQDGKIFPSGQGILEGEEALRKYWIPASDSKYKITYHQIIPEEIRVLGEEAYDYGYYEGRSMGPDGKESSWSGKYVIVWKKVAPDDWRMYLDIWNRID